jgi:hypothetical protein
MHLGVDEESFPFHCTKKTIFHFPGAEKGFFCEAPTTNMLQNLRTTFFENTRPILYAQITKLLPPKMFPSTSFEKHKLLPIQLETCQI